MTVKELIDYLEKCNPDTNVVDSGEYQITDVISHIDIVNPDNSFVMIA